MGRTPKGEKALTGAERQKRYHEKQKQQTPELCKEINADRNVKQKSALQRIKSDHPDVYSKWRKAKNQYERKRRFGHKVEKYQAEEQNNAVESPAEEVPDKDNEETETTQLPDLPQSKQVRFSHESWCNYNPMHGPIFLFSLSQL
jgi:hypothetical protein